LAGKRVTGVVRTRESAEILEGVGITPLVCDLDGEDIPAGPHDEIYYFAPPPAAGNTDPRMRRFLGKLADMGHTPRIVYTSTSGVYGDCGGDWVDETRPVRAATDRARRRLDAEQALLEWSGESGGEVIILRVAGIYGPGRLPLESLRRKTPVIHPSEASWTNRIHAEDLVTVCQAAMASGGDGEIYNVSDGHPGTMTEYFNLVADLAGLDRPPVLSRAEAEEKLPASLMSFLRESRRLDNSKMINELGVRLLYPTLKEGVPASF
jgi:nucleoside-diphosphate-sugar epimerase